MSEEIVERVAQLQHENSKLLDELNYLKEHMLLVEEALNSKCSELSEEKKRIKSLEQQVNSTFHLIKDKDQLIDSLENDKKRLKELHGKVLSKNLSLKEDLLQEKEKNKQMEILKAKEEDLKSAYAKVKQENQKLILELSEKSDECLSSAASIKDLLLQVKELQNEKAELLAMRDTLLIQEKEDRLKSSGNLESFLRKSPEWRKSQLNLFAVQDENSTTAPFSREISQVTLRQEILEVELQEKQEKIEQLENLLRKKEEDELERNKSILELKKELLHAGLLGSDSKIDLRLDSSAFYNIYNKLLKIIYWPEGQPGECKPLTDETALSVVVKDGVQTTQPSSVRVIETISIASQTDPLKNLSPVLLFRTFEKPQSNIDLNETRSDSDEDGEEALSFDENDEVKKGFQLFSEPKNCDLDMDMYRMYKRSNSSLSDQLDGSSLDLSEDSSASDLDSDTSRDFNLNSKKFTDCNLPGTERQNKNSSKTNYSNDDEMRTKGESLNSENIFSSENNEKKETHKEKTDSEEENSEILPEPENSSRLVETKKNTVPFTSSSTPKPGLTDSQALCNIFSVSSDGSPSESDNKDATFLVLKAALKQNSCFAIEEITKKFQDLSFAFKTDSMTIQKRLQLMKRRRDQAESNIENEIKVIKTKMKTLQYLGLNSEYLSLMSDLKKQLDFLLNAIIQLSSSAEGYGYAQHEERFLELVAVMLQHVENVENSKSSESSKASDKVKEEREEKFLRRRSVAAITMENHSKRRASIAALPRVCFLASENGNSNNNNNNNSKGPQCTPSRPAGNAAKKLSFSQASPKAQGSNFDDTRRDSINVRHRRESRSSESSMKNIDETPESQSTSVDSKIIEEPIASLANMEISDSSLNLKQLFGSVEEIRRNSNSQEKITPGYCIRRIIEWNKLLVNSTRFRWPENVLHFIPFYITWYVVFVLAFVFIGGLFTGINVCYSFSCLKYTALWFAAPAFFTFTRRFYRILLPLFLALIFTMVLFFLWLTKILLPRMTNEEIDTLFRTFGFEIRYLYGPPPV